MAKVDGVFVIFPYFSLFWFFPLQTYQLIDCFYQVHLYSYNKNVYSDYFGAFLPLFDSRD